MSAGVVDRLGKQRTMPWSDAVAGAQGQGMGASSARRCKMQLERGTTGGATLLAQPSLSSSLTRAALGLTYHQCI